MSTPKERVQLELRELELKYLDLDTLLSKPQPKFISDMQWALLNEQHVVMWRYHSILSTRLANWEG